MGGDRGAVSTSSSSSSSSSASISSASSSSFSSLSRLQNDEQSYYALLRELAIFLTEQNDVMEQQQHHQHRNKIEITAEAGRLLRDAAAVLSDSRPPPDFVVYPEGWQQGMSASSSTLSGSNSSFHPYQPQALQPQQQQRHHDMQQQQQQQHEQQEQQQQQQRMFTNSSPSHNNEGRPPIFDGSVANATPPPLGGSNTGIAGGAGTILHLACALDVPLALAFLLAMGADARASHTAFRRLMIHEAACNGSVQCLTLLLELGRKYGDQAEAIHDARAALGRAPRGAHGASGTTAMNEYDLPFMPRRMDRAEAIAPLQLYARQVSLFGKKSAPPPPPSPEGKDFLTLLRLFREYVSQVRAGTLSELDAARKLMDHAVLNESSRTSLARSCNFLSTYPPPRTLLRPHGGNSDGHGNTPLHWAAFKNETACVSLLLQYQADPNARAHPSGWTPLHDAAYSNSRDTIELLLNAGAQVDARANSGATPLCFAAQEDAAEAAELLLQRGAMLTTRCAGGPVRDDGTVQPPGTVMNNGPHSRFSGYTPLHYCAHYNAAKAARVLLRHSTCKAAMEIPDLSERLPIHVAVARGSSDVLRELLHAGARVETRSKEELRKEAAERRRHGRSSSSASMSSSSSLSVASSSTSAAQRRQRQQQMFHSFTQGVAAAVAAANAPSTPRRQAPSPERVSTTPRSRSRSVTPVSSPVLRSMIPSRPVSSSKPWNCLTQRSIDECKKLITEAEKSWTPDRHLLFTPADRKAVMELLRVGKRLEQQGTGIFIDLWPQILSFCGRGWFEKEEEEEAGGVVAMIADSDEDDGIVEMDCDIATTENGGTRVVHHVIATSAAAAATAAAVVTPTSSPSASAASNHGLSLPRF